MQNELTENLDKLHTTPLGIERIRRNCFPECGIFCRPREVLIKSDMQIAQIDFSGGVFRLRKICKQDACRDLFSASLGAIYAHPS